MPIQINGTTGIAGVDGSAATPALQGTDTNTGISFGSDVIIGSTGGVERWRTTPSGQWLVGTPTATNNVRLDQKVGVVGVGANTYTGIACTGYSGTAAAASPVIDLQRSRGTTDGSFTKVEGGDRLGVIIFRGADGTQFLDGALIEAYADTTTGANDLPTRLVFSTCGDGSATVSERMRITNGGNIRLGSASAYNSEFFTVNNGGGITSEITAFGGSGGVNHRFYFHTGVPGNAAGTVYWTNSNGTTGRSINAGGTINASGADYAEYMVKAGDFTIAKGDICGVTSNGLLTVVYKDSIGFFVKSTNPSYVGNDGWGAGYENNADGLESVRKTVDRIAFAGQVPVNVMGAVPGQYIVPVEAADGGIEGIAKNEDDLTLAEYMRAVGKVIAIEDDGRARIIVKVA